LLLATALNAALKPIRGKVTYIAAGSVYTSLGKDLGLKDSTLLVVVSRMDTIATMKVVAASSKSSSCVIVSSSRPVAIGDDVWGNVVQEVERSSPADSASHLQAADGAPLPVIRRARSVAVSNVAELHGRVSAQYITSLYDQSAFNIAQSGIVVNLRGTLRDVPLRLDLYANLRSLAVGNQNPFARTAVNQSRIYEMALSYDDGGTVASLGRVIPTSSPSVGYIDGALFSKRFGNVVIGTTVGFQPDWSMRDVTTDYRKFALFAQYSTPDRISLFVSGAYARTYFHSALDREAVSLLVNTALTGSLYLYGNAEMDMRKKANNDFVLAPRVTSAYANLHYRVSNSFSVGVGAEASRTYYSYEAVRNFPDSLVVNTLRSGMNVSVNWFLPWGIALYESYRPRSSSGPFGKEFSNSSSIGISDIFSSGINVRANVNTNTNQYTNVTAYGVTAQTTIVRSIDVTLRFLGNGYLVKQTEQRMHGRTLGVDLMFFLTREFTLLAMYDRRDDYGMITHAVFAEIGVRF
jgi:hypothetical protein